jgi:hypothetical protein
MIDRAVRPWVARVVRLGYAAKGLIYTLIGLLAMRVAFGLRGGRLTDPVGVLRSLLNQPFGLAMLALIGIGIVGYAAYYVFEAVADLRRKGGGVRGWIDRSLTIIKAVAYGAIGVAALRIVIGGRPGGNPEDGARVVMQYPFGGVFLALVGIGVAIYGMTQIRMAWHGGADDDLDVSRVRREAAWILPFGRFGTAARSVILVLMGATLAWAGWRERPAHADGYGDALSTIASFHPWLLGAIGAGLFCFGVYQFCHARYAKIAIA